MHAAGQDLRKTPYLLLLLLPLLLLGLASYNDWAQPLRSDFGLQGLLPRRLTASQPFELSLLQAPDAPAYTLWLETPRDQTLQPLASRTEAPTEATAGSALWRSQLPALAAGVYWLHWQKPGSTDKVRSLPIFVTQHQGLMLSDQSHYAPGDTVVVQLQQLPQQLRQIQLRITAAGRSRLAPVNLQAGAGQWRGQIERDVRGPIRIEALGLPHPPRPLYLPVRAEAAATDNSLQIWPLTDVVAPGGRPQNLHVFALTAAGQPVENGWIQVLGKSFAIQSGRALITLPENFQAKKLNYAAGDSQGHLAQGSWPLRRSAGAWHAAFAPETQVWQLASAQPRPLFWLLFQGQQALAQGVLNVGPEPQTLSLPALPAAPTALLLQDDQGHSQWLHWLPAAGRGEATVRPVQPHALQPLNLDVKTTGPLLDLARYQVLGQHALAAPQAAGTWHDLADSTLASPAAGLPLWLLAALLCIAGPWVWLWRLLQQRIRLHQRPFASSQRKRVILALQQQLLGFAFAGCGLALVSALPLPAWLPLTAALLLSLSGGGLASWQFRQLRLGLHPVSPWLPLLQAQLWFWSFCFVWAHQPLSQPALFLVWALCQLGWWLWFQRLAPLPQRSQQPALVLLASLTVLSPLLLLQVLRQPAQPLSAVPLTLQQVLTQPADRLQLLQYSALPARQLSLSPAYHDGQHRLQWRSPAVPPGVLQPLSFAQTLQVQPAVLAEARVPPFALSGDQLQIPVLLRNATDRPQPSSYRLGGQLAQPLTLAAQEIRTAVASWTARGTGWQDLTLQHFFAGTWFSREASVFVQTAESARQDPDLQLEIALPALRQVLIDEEIPVRLRFSHRLPVLGEGVALGIQIGIPAGFEVLTDTLEDPNYTRWLQSHTLKAGYLNLRTHPLAAQTPYGAHFRLRATLAGRMQAPSSRLFVLNQPERLTRVAHPERFEVRRP